MSLLLLDKVVVVTGGARGIGFAVAKKFREAGAQVVIGDIDGTAVLSAPFTVGFHRLDVTDRESVSQFVAYVMGGHGQIDVLVNNAGITRDASLAKMTEEQFDQVIDVNLKGVYNMTKAVAPVMTIRGSGVILNASSIVAHGNFGQTNYAASKAAVESMTVTWSREFAKKGVRVNAVAPGFTDTEMVAAMNPEAKAKIIEKIPLGRLATVDEIADAYLYLATARYITGVTLTVAGGLSV